MSHCDVSPHDASPCAYGLQRSYSVWFLCTVFWGGRACGKGKPFPLIPTCPHDPFSGLYLTSVGKHQLHSMREDPRHLCRVRLARMFLEHLKTSCQSQWSWGPTCQWKVMPLNISCMLSSIFHIIGYTRQLKLFCQSLLHIWQTFTHISHSYNRHFTKHLANSKPSDSTGDNGWIKERAVTQSNKTVTEKSKGFCGSTEKGLPF